jgi:hypothetical protein
MRLHCQPTTRANISGCHYPELGNGLLDRFCRPMQMVQKHLCLGGGRGGSTNLADWTHVMQVDCAYPSGMAIVFDPESKNYSRRFYRLAPLSTVP